MKCPKCADLPLTRSIAAGLELDQCLGCGGLWLDESELPRLLEAGRPAVKDLLTSRDRSGANDRRGSCPHCGSGLLRVTSAQKRRVTVDKCADCGGVWLDGGEFAELFAEEGD